MNLNDLRPGYDDRRTQQIWHDHIGGYIDNICHSACDWWSFNTGEQDGATWVSIHNYWVADPEKFKRWYTLYRLGVRHRAGT